MPVGGYVGIGIVAVVAVSICLCHFLDYIDYWAPRNQGRGAAIETRAQRREAERRRGLLRLQAPGSPPAVSRLPPVPQPQGVIDNEAL